jgi:tRNA-dihydrouridine synthase
VIGNGDIRSPRKALSRLAESGADGVMISRYTATCPWVFRQIRDAVEGRTSLFQPHKTDLWLEFFDRTASLYPEEEARVRIARWNAYFAQHFAFGHRFQLAVRNAPTLNEARRLGLEFLERNA